jgi:hypothetical protein
MCNWLGGTIITLVLPYFDVFWPLFAFFSAVCFICVVWVWLVVIETKGKSKVEIHNMYLPESLIESNVDDVSDLNDVSANNI